MIHSAASRKHACKLAPCKMHGDRRHEVSPAGTSKGNSLSDRSAGRPDRSLSLVRRCHRTRVQPRRRRSVQPLMARLAARWHRHQKAHVQWLAIRMLVQFFSHCPLCCSTCAAAGQAKMAERNETVIPAVTSVSEINIGESSPPARLLDDAIDSLCCWIRGVCDACVCGDAGARAGGGAASA